jgi:hypothetical protein
VSKNELFADLAFGWCIAGKDKQHVIEHVCCEFSCSLGLAVHLDNFYNQELAVEQRRASE